MVTIKNRKYLFFLFGLLFLTCEDKKKERNDFGSISINIIFENQVADSPVNDSESDRVIEDSEVITDSLKQFLKEGKQKTEDGKLPVEENKNKDDLSKVFFIYLFSFRLSHKYNENNSYFYQI